MLAIYIYLTKENTKTKIKNIIKRLIRIIKFKNNENINKRNNKSKNFNKVSNKNIKINLFIYK
jgi:hypothetical protein